MQSSEVLLHYPQRKWDLHPNQDTQIQAPAVQAGGGQDPSQFTGVSIKSFNKEQDQGEIVDFLVSSGLKEEYKENINFNFRGDVTISDVENTHCQELITALHLAKVPGDSKKTLKCNGIIPYTPPKTKPSGPADKAGFSVASALDLSNKQLEKIPDLVISSGSGTDSGSDITENDTEETIRKKKMRKNISPGKENERKKFDSKPTPDKK
jgi:hypothetical protein